MYEVVGSRGAFGTAVIFGELTTIIGVNVVLRKRKTWFPHGEILTALDDYFIVDRRFRGFRRRFGNQFVSSNTANIEVIAGARNWLQTKGRNEQPITERELHTGEMHLTLRGLCG